MPVHPQVGHRPGHRAGDEQPGRTNRGDLAAGRQPGPHRGDEPVTQALAGRVLERGQHGRGHVRAGQLVARGGRARGVDVGRPAQRQAAGVGGRTALGVDGGDLAPGHVGGPPGQGRERVTGGAAARHRVQQGPAQPWVGGALAAYRARAGPDGRASRGHGHAGRRDDRADRAGPLAPAHQGEGHGFTATTVTSTSHSGRASALTTSPVDTGWTPRNHRPTTR